MGLKSLARTWSARLAAAAAMCCAGSAFAQLSIPPNDLCENAEVIAVNSFSTIRSSANATAINDGPASSCNTASANRGVWFTFTTGAAGKYQVSARSSVWDSVVTVFSTVDCTTHNPGAFIQVPNGCNDDWGGTVPSVGSGTPTTFSSVVPALQLAASTQYWVRLSAFSNTGAGWYEVGVFTASSTGACCNNNGACLITTGDACTPFSSTLTWMGNGSVCAPNPCTGACCSSIDFSCSITRGGTGCFTSGLPGVWQGYGSTCTAGLCSLGRCCSNTTGACSITLQRSCTSTSAWAGAGTLCNPITICNTGTGVCCNNNTFACTVAMISSAANCPAGSTFAGIGSACSPTNACAVGSCCTTGLVCTRTTYASCVASSNSNLFVASAATCQPNPCQTVCCATNGSCSVITGVSGCPTGFSQGVTGWACSPTNPCAVGACCSGSTCTFGFRTGCNTATTSTIVYYAGDNTVCTPDNVCTSLLGSCCSSTGTCSVTTAIGCTGTSVFQGVGSNLTASFACSSTTTPGFCTSASVLGSCCSNTGVCSVTTFNNCGGTSTFMGLGTNQNAAGTGCLSTTYCTTDATSILGTCCSTGGTCSVTTNLGCTGGSTWTSIGSAAACASTVIGNATNPCTATLGACCQGAATSACTVTTAAGCVFPAVYKPSGYAGAPATTCATTTCQDAATIYGACCAAVGGASACTITTANNCLGTNVWQSYNVAGYTGTVGGAAVTTCTANFCLRTDLYGACCSSTAGTCTISTQNGCAFPNEWQGLNGYTAAATTCNATYCTAATSGNYLLGACCSGTSTGCTVTTQSNCKAPAVWQGVGNAGGTTGYSTGTACVTNWCQGTSTSTAAVIYGACCPGTAGSCTVTTEAGCAAIAGTTAGFFPAGYTAGTTCATPGANWCQGNASGAVIYGGCCSATGTCTVTLQAACVGPSTWYSGAYSAAGTTACIPALYCQANNSGAFLLGACCNVNGVCSVTTALGCNGVGTFQGVGGGGYTTGTTCTASWCTGTNTSTGLAILGACCLTDGSCVARTAAGCQGNKQYAGAGTGYTSGTACDPTTYCNTGAGNVTGACCSTTTGACAVTTSGGCPSPNSFNVLGSTCTGSFNYCGGACCRAFVCAATLNAGQCVGGTFTNNAVCSSNPCPAITTFPSVCEAFDTVAPPALPSQWTSAFTGGGSNWTTVVDGTAPTSPNAVFVIDPTTTSTASLTLPTVIAQGPIGLDLMARWAFETCCDGWFIEAKVNAGAFANVGSAAFINGTIAYTGNLTASGGGNFGSANQATYIQKTVGLGNTVLGDQVTFRITMFADVSGGAAGLFVDSVCIYNAINPSGACCATDGTCTITASCSSPSLFQGVASVCGPSNTCTVATKACCSTTTNACTFTTAASCPANTYQNGAVCSANPCSSTGACCHADGTCTAELSTNCLTPDLFVGTNFTCSGAVCPVTVGACCSNTLFTCTYLAQSSCTGANTFIAGTCGTVTCPTDGACCANTGVCTLVAPASCTSPSVFVGLGTSCSAGNCPSGTAVACCNDTTAVCVYTAGTTCSAAGTHSNGPNSVCSPNTCLATAYCTDTATSASFEKISNITFGTINQSDATTVGYIDFTSLTPPNLTIAIGTTITVTLRNCFSSDLCTVYVDWNHNFLLTDTGENFVLAGPGAACTGSGTPGTFTGSIAPPPSALSGTTRMRVVMGDGTAPACGSYTFGQVWDFTVNVLPPVNGACCRTTGACTIDLPTNCLAPDFFRGAGTLCSGAGGTCPDVVSACCNTSTAVCTYTLGTTCGASNVNLGAGSVCSPNSCPTTGACCKTDGTCSVELAAACTSPNLFQTLGTTCSGAGATCPIATTACCNGLSSACLYVNGATCPGGSTATGGVCSPTPCVGLPGFVQNFDSGAGLPACWATSTTGVGTNWAVVSDQSNSAFNSIFAVDQTDTSSETITLPVFTALGPVTLDLWARWQCESATGTWDGWLVEVSINGGAFTNLTPAAWSQNGYSATEVLNATSPNPYAGQSAFLHTSGGGATPIWVNPRAGITAAIGDQVQIRFVMTSDDSVGTPTYVGVWIDDITIANAAANGTCCDTAGLCTYVSSANCTGSWNASNCSCTPNPCTQPQVGICCLTTGVCATATPGNPLTTNLASCASGTLTVNGTCTPNTCPAPPAGVCCRGATCSTAFADAAACSGPFATSATGGPAWAFVLTALPCNAGVLADGNYSGALTSTQSPCCFANYNHSPGPSGLEVQDIFDFLNDWFAGRPIAIPGGDGASLNGLAVQNIFNFLNAWFAGGCS